VIDTATGPLVLAAHSGGGFDITEVGDHPEVAHMVFMNVFMPGSGVDTSEAMGRVLDRTDNDEDLNYFRPDWARETLFEDLPTEQMEAAVAGMVPTERWVGVPIPQTRPGVIDRPPTWSSMPTSRCPAMFSWARLR
jgi:hypothetical protein